MVEGIPEIHVRWRLALSEETALFQFGYCNTNEITVKHNSKGPPDSVWRPFELLPVTC